ncbi:Glycerate kinase [hydrothermal vent metagenome]|uniref:Glycerate kinase n=1 Tax=hydrothermal vent metagenome TaxID=652676 RepID=A0A3B0X218_9ZZZZ
MPSYLIAPDSFKGSISAAFFCQIVQQAILQKQPDATVLTRPLSDGGEGFIDAFVQAELAKEQTLWCAGPLGRKVKAKWAWIADSNTAIIEMAQASGLTRLRPEDRNPLQTHTTGTGHLIQAAIKKGAHTIILGLGGSATNEGGVGALKALGIPFLNAQNKEIGLGGQALQTLTHIGDVPPKLLNIKWVLACDVTNPLLGEQGATQIFGAQKGMTAQSAPILEKGLENLANLMADKTGHAIQDQAGSGAAGGMAAGFMELLNAQMYSGFEVLNTHLNLDLLFEQHTIDYLITGEGKIDQQTAFGKLPQRIAQLAKQHNPHCKTIGLCGQLDTTLAHLPEFDALFSILPKPMAEYHAMQQTPELLKHTTQSILNLLTKQS